MQTKILFIDENHFPNLDGFYDAIEQVLTKDLNWQAGHNLDAFNDLLCSGFNVTKPYEPFTLVIAEQQQKL